MRNDSERAPEAVASRVPAVSRGPGAVHFTGSDALGGPGDVSFVDVAWTHRVRAGAESEGERAEAEADERYRFVLEAFEHAHGCIVAAYFSRRTFSAAAVTDPRGQTTAARQLLSLLRLRRAARRRARTALHCATSWDTRADARLAERLHRCESLQIRVQEILLPTQARIATQWLFAIVSRILARLDVLAERGDAVDASEAAELAELADLDAELQRTTEYYERAAARAARMRLVTGAAAGLAAVAVVGLVIAGAFDGVDVGDGALVAVVAGAAGAVVSVLSRLAQPGLVLDTELPPRTIQALGAFRPLLGAVLGTAAYLAVETELVVIGSGSGAAYFALLGFVAGFGERFARDLVTAAQAPLYERSAAARYRETVELVDRLPTAVTETVRDVLRGPELANWSGYASAGVDGRQHGVATPRAELRLIVRLSADETGAENERPIDIREGVDEDPVVFEARADSDTVYFADEEHALAVRPAGGAELALPFTAPGRPGEHRIWVQLLQQNRLVQALPVDLEVREGG